MRLDRLFFEFIFEVYREKVILGTPALEQSDVNIFFKNKSVQNDDIASWKDTTILKLKNCYVNYMTDANLLTAIDNSKTITPPIIDIALKRYLIASGDEAMVKAITGVN